MRQPSSRWVLVLGLSLLARPALATPWVPPPAWHFEADAANTFLGASVASADVNGDGYTDVIGGAYGYDGGQVDEGQVVAFYGSAAGLPPSPSWIAEGDQDGAFAGNSVASAGDVNGDGYEDVIVGLNGWTNGQRTEGAARVYLGSPAGLSAAPAWTVESDQVDARLGYVVSSAGDVNGDGFGDVAVGAFWYDGGQADEGAVFVYLGSAAGLGTLPARVIESDQIEARLGCAVASAGDVEGDGFGDLLVGSCWYSNPTYHEGAAFLYSGSPAGLCRPGRHTAPRRPATSGRWWRAPAT